MSIAIMTEVWKHSKADGTDLLVLLALADMANDDGECWPSMSTIGRKCRLSTRNARYRIRALEKIDEVVVIVGAGTASSKGGLRSNRYRITVHMDPDTATSDLITDREIRQPATVSGKPDTATSDLQIRQPIAALIRQPIAAETKTGNAIEPLAPADADAEGFASLQMTIFDVCGVDPDKIAESKRNGYAKAVRSIASVGATPNDVNTAASRWRSLYPSANLTVFALDKHWAALTAGPERNRTTVPEWTAAQSFGRHAALLTADPEEARRQIEDELGNDDPGISEAIEAFTDRRRNQFGDARQLQTAEPF